MKCFGCGYCENTIDCVFFPSEAFHKLQFFKNSRIIKDGKYYYLNRCEHYVGGQCDMHDDRRPVLCIIYPIIIRNGVLTVDPKCPAHETVTPEDIEWARQLIPLKDSSLDDLVEASARHNSS